MDFLFDDSLAFQVLISAFLGRKQKVREAICDHSIDFFGHGAIKASQSGLDVSYRYLKFCRRQGTGHGQLNADLLESSYALGSLDRVSSAANLKVKVRRGHIQVVEKSLAHGFIVMLTRMDEAGIEPVAFRQLS
jgi:hypothetical protein